MNQIFAAVIALAAMAGVTIYEGIRFEFWNAADPEELNYFAKRLEAVPESFGDWTSQPAAVDDVQLEAAQIRAYVSRDYVNLKTGVKINVFLVCGKTHPMAIHSPDQCYAAAGFKQGDASRKYVDVNGRTAELWSSRFIREVDQAQQDIVWSWAPDDGMWQAPTNPRFDFSTKNALYKIYLITQPGREADGDMFLREFLPVLDKVLFAPIESEARDDSETTS